MIHLDRNKKIMAAKSFTITQTMQKWLNGIVLFIASIFIYSFIKSYIKQFNPHQDAEISFGATLFFLAGTFVGSFIALLWINNSEKSKRRLIIILPIIIVILALFLAISSIALRANPNHPIAVLATILPFVFLSLAIGMFAKMIRHSIHQQIHDANTVAVNSQAELQLLQSQLSPHFLFNTLNNLYGLSLSQSQKLPPLLLKLSELLRYSVYDARESYVLLKNEIDYIRNFVDFERMRIGDRLDLKLQLEEISGLDMKIAPMLLIIFLENAFKHSKNSIEEKIFIEIALKTWGSSLLFSVKNSHTRTLPEGQAHMTNSGLGLENARKRLELLYPGEYNLEVLDEEQWYTVLLTLKLKT